MRATPTTPPTTPPAIAPVLVELLSDAAAEVTSNKLLSIFKPYVSYSRIIHT